MSVIFLDESGGLAPGRPSVFAVAGIMLDRQTAERVVRRFRKDHPTWRALELKGSEMDDRLQRWVVRRALRSAGAVAAVAIADDRMAHAMWAASELGEHHVYAALVAEVLAALGTPAARAVADGGRYTGTIMRQLPGAVDAYYAALAQSVPAGAGDPPAAGARLSFVPSYSSAGVQVADVLANLTHRAWRASRVSAGLPSRADAAVPVYPATLAALPLPPWLERLSPAVGPGHVAL